MSAKFLLTHKLKTSGTASHPLFHISYTLSLFCENNADSQAVVEKNKYEILYIEELYGKTSMLKHAFFIVLQSKFIALR